VRRRENKKKCEFNLFRDSSVGIALGCGLDDRGSTQNPFMTGCSVKAQDNFNFTFLSAESIVGI
jgi:hypothetical protein